MTIAVDFDGTLHIGFYPNIGKPKSNAVTVMRKLKAQGHFIIIWTCREGIRQLEMIKWLRNNGIPFDKINENNPANISEYGNDCRKISADIYIDDRQIGGLPPWHKIYDMIAYHRVTVNHDAKIYSILYGNKNEPENNELPKHYENDKE